MSSTLATPGPETDTALALHRRTPAHAAFAAAQERLLARYGLAASSRYVDLGRPQLRAHVLEAGHGEPLLVLHGGDGQGVDWAPLLADLQDDFHCNAIDRPGFGLTDPFDYRRVDLRRHAADFVVSALDALGVETATLAGGSMGGFFALAAALERPDRVRSLILVGMPVGLARTIPVPLRILCGVPGLARVVTAHPERASLAARRTQYQRMFRVDLSTVPDVYFEMQVAGMRIPGALPTWGVLLTRIAGLGGIRREVMLADDLPRLEIPTLVLWGERDLIPAPVGEKACRRIPGARFVELPGIGHFPFLEAPQACAGLIRDFLAAGQATASKGGPR